MRMDKKTRISGLRDTTKISLGVRNLLRENQGLTWLEIRERLPDECPELLGITIRRLSHNGSVVVRNEKYYALSSSVKVKVRLQRQRRRNCNINSLRITRRGMVSSKTASPQTQKRIVTTTPNEKKRMVKV